MVLPLVGPTSQRGTGRPHCCRTGWCPGSPRILTGSAFEQDLIEQYKVSQLASFLLMILVAPMVVLTERDVFCSWACWTRSGNKIPWTTTFENLANVDIKAWQLPVSKNPWTCLKNHGLYQVPISLSFPGSQQSTRFPVITTAWWIETFIKSTNRFHNYLKDWLYNLITHV